MLKRIRSEDPSLSVVVPVYNEESNLEQLYKRLVAVLKSLVSKYEIIFVDDGSSDNSINIIKEFADKDNQVKYISFSRNFGHEAASTAGMNNSTGDAVVLIDADLQDPPEVIPQLFKLWKEDGYDVIYAQRKKRKGENIFKKTTSFLFYRFINYLSSVKLPKDTGDFRLMDRAVIENFSRFNEKSRFVRGLITWIGFAQTAIQYDRDARFAGETKYSIKKLVYLSLDVIISFSIIPLRAIAFLGFLIVAFSVIYALVMVIQKLFSNYQLIEHSVLITAIFFLGGIQMLSLGVIGEYLGKIFIEVQNRPLYIIKDKNTDR